MNTLDLTFDWLLQASLRASILTLVVLATQHLLRKHLSARLLHALWLPVLIVTLMPVWPQSPWSAESLIMEARPENISAPAAPAKPAPLTAQAPIVVEAERSLSWLQMAALTWAAGSAAFIMAGLISLHCTLRNFRRTACTPETEVVDMVASLAGQIALKRTPHICQSEIISSPAVAGLFRPVLLLPAHFSQTFTTREAELVLKHELMHLKRGDLIMNALLCALMALHWFNPLLWLAFHKARIDREAACDEDVLRRGSPDERCAYGHALLKAQSAFCPRGWSLGFVGIFDRGAGLRTRIRAIASPGSRDPQMKLLACILMALTTYLGSTQAQSDAPGKKSPQILIDTKLGPDLSEASESVRSRSDVHGQSVVMDVQVIDFPSSAKLKTLSARTTLKDGLTIINIAPGKADQQLKALTDEGGEVLSRPRMYVVSGNEGRLEVKSGGKPFVNEASFVGTRCSLLPTIQGERVNLDVKIEHASVPGQVTTLRTTESMENGSTVLMGRPNDGAGRNTFPLILITLAWNAEEGPLMKKLRSIIIPRVQFRDATLEEALEFFRVKARALDTDETDPGKRGVNIVLKTKAASSARITLDLIDVPLEEALKYTVELANLEYWFEGSAVAIMTKAKVSQGGQPDKHSALKGEAVDKAKQMILPKMKFENASVQEAAEFFQARMRGSPEMAGISIILKPGGPKGSISMDLHDVPLWEALRYVTELGGMTLAAEGRTITISPPDVK